MILNDKSKPHKLTVVGSNLPPQPKQASLLRGFMLRINRLS